MIDFMVVTIEMIIEKEKKKEYLFQIKKRSGN